MHRYVNIRYMYCIGVELNIQLRDIIYLPGDIKYYIGWVCGLSHVTL